MLRTSLKTAISCLVLQTWLMCLLRQRTGRVLFITLALVAASQQARLPLNQGTAHVERPHLLNFLDGRHLALHHQWHIDNSVDDTLRDTLLENALDHSRYFFHDSWYGDVDNSAPQCAAERTPVGSITQLL